MNTGREERKPQRFLTLFPSHHGEGRKINNKVLESFE